jgi:hypothetical protein
MRTDVDCELPRLAFIHIPKTAGTSITNTISELYGALTFPAMTTLDYACYKEDEIEHFRFYKGHSYYRDFRRLPGGTIFFSVFRGPTERAISLYRYWRSIDVTHIADPIVSEACEIARSSGIIDFIYSDNPFIIEHLRLGLIRQFLSEELLLDIGHRRYLARQTTNEALAEFKSRLDGIDYVMTCDYIDVSYFVMSSSIGLPSVRTKMRNDNASPKCDIGGIFDIRRAMLDVSPLDFHCYEMARKKERDILTRHFIPTS